MKRLLPIALLAAVGCVRASTFEKLQADYATSLKRVEQSDASLASCSRRVRSDPEIEKLKKGWTLVPVVVASQDISENTVLTFDMISQRPVPEQFVTTSVVKPDSASYIVGQEILMPVQTGDMLLWSMFETSKSVEKLSSFAKKDLRIFTVETTPASSCGQWVRPNDHVDVIAVLPSSEGKGMVATTVLENALVVATGKITGQTNLNLVPEGERAFKHVSLLVKPEEAERLALAQALGKLTLALRSSEDEGLRKSATPTTVKALFTKTGTAPR